MSYDELSRYPQPDAALVQNAPHRRQFLAVVYGSLVVLGALAMMELDASLALLSLGFVALAFTVGFLCWFFGVKADREAVSAWDLAGASALVGFAAAAIAD